jgi:putative sigma-54 modulation protein
MKITLQTTDFKASRKLQKFVNQHVGKLAYLNDRILDCNVFLRLENSNDQANKVCELKLVVRGNDLFASRKCESFEQAIVECVDALKHQLNRRKESTDRGKLRRRKSSRQPEGAPA